MRSYKSLQHSLIAARWMPVTEAAMDRALEVHAALADRGMHRHFSLPDLFIAATAELAGATVLHYDSDYDRIAAVPGQDREGPLRGSPDGRRSGSACGPVNAVHGPSGWAAVDPGDI